MKGGEPLRLHPPCRISAVSDCALSSEILANLRDALLLQSQKTLGENVRGVRGERVGDGHLVIHHGLGSNLLAGQQILDELLLIVGQSSDEARHGGRDSPLERLASDRLEGKVRLAPGVFELRSVQLAGIPPDEAGDEAHLIIALDRRTLEEHDALVVGALSAERQALEELLGTDLSLGRERFTLRTRLLVLAGLATVAGRDVLLSDGSGLAAHLGGLVGLGRIANHHGLDRGRLCGVVAHDEREGSGNGRFGKAHDVHPFCPWLGCPIRWDRFIVREGRLFCDPLSVSR